MPFSVLGLGAQWNRNSFSSPGAQILDGESNIKHALKITPDIARVHGGGGVCVRVHVWKPSLALDRVTQGGSQKAM